jgi:hypothetical protein
MTRIDAAAEAERWPGRGVWRTMSSSVIRRGTSRVPLGVEARSQETTPEREFSELALVRLVCGLVRHAPRGRSRVSIG